MTTRVLRYLLPILSAMVLAAGCGSDDGGGGGSKAKKSSAKKEDPKQRNLDQAKEGFEKNSNNSDACRNLAMAYIAVASPESSGKKGEVPKQPKDRKENLGKAVDTLERCTEIKKNDINTKQMLASTYMALGEYDKAAPLLEDVARSRRNDPNAYYAWGLAASNAQNNDDLFTAWEKFLDVAPKNDPRVKQVRAALKSLRESEKPANKKKPAAAAEETSEESADDSAEN